MSPKPEGRRSRCPPISLRDLLFPVFSESLGTWVICQRMTGLDRSGFRLCLYSMLFLNLNTLIPINPTENPTSTSASLHKLSIPTPFSKIPRMTLRK